MHDRTVVVRHQVASHGLRELWFQPRRDGGEVNVDKIVAVLASLLVVEAEGVADLMHDGAHPAVVADVDLVEGVVVHADGGVAHAISENELEVVRLRGAGAEIDARLVLPVAMIRASLAVRPDAVSIAHGTLWPPGHNVVPAHSPTA